MWHLVRGLGEIRTPRGIESWECCTAATSYTQGQLWMDLMRRRLGNMVDTTDGREGTILEVTFQVTKVPDDKTMEECRTLMGITAMQGTGWRKIDDDLLTLTDRPPAVN